MRAIFSALCALLAVQASAQSVVSMERLFTTPSERAQLDAQRSQAPAAALSAAAGVGGNAGAAGGAAGATAIPGTAANAATAPCTPGVPGCPAAGEASGTGGAVVTAGAGAAPGSEQGAQEAPGLRLDGVIRRSNGPTVLIVNGEVQPAPAGSVARGAVTLQADGRSVVLRPGQRYDPATGKVDENER